MPIERTSPRTSYRNGDPIRLACGCDSCNPDMINGSLCHETGCPDAWRDYETECAFCGCDFWPEDSGQLCCDRECHGSYFGVY